MASAVDRERVAADGAARGFGCDLWVDPPGRRWEDFVHPTDELVMVVEGKQEFEIEGVVSRPARESRAPGRRRRHPHGPELLPEPRARSAN